MGQGSPYDWIQYHTIGMRVTNDGGANFAYCGYVDGTQIGCKTIGTAQGSDVSTAGDRNGGFGLQGGGIGGGGSPATGDINAKYQWFHLYSCASWNTGWSYNSGTGVGTSNGNPCAGSLITSNP